MGEGLKEGVGEKKGQVAKTIAYVQWSLVGLPVDGRRVGEA